MIAEAAETGEEFTGIADARACYEERLDALGACAWTASAGIGRGIGFTAKALKKLPRYLRGTARAADNITSAADDIVGSSSRFIGNAAGDILDTTRVTGAGWKAGYLVKDPGKSGIFADRLGFDEAGMDAALRSHLTSNFGSASSSVPMLNGAGQQIGTRFVVRGPMTGPSGRTFDITASWGVDYDGTVRFITAFPTN